MQLVARHVEVGEAVVLFLDLDVALREMLVLALDGLELLEDRLVLTLQLVDLREQLVTELVPALVGLGGVAIPGLELVELPPQPRVLVEQLLRELGPAVEDGQDGFSAVGALLLDGIAHPRPRAPSLWEPARPTPRWIASGISCRGRTRSASPAFATCFGMP